MFDRLTRSPVLMSWASLLLQLGSGLVILPLLLKALGPQDLGLWFLFSIVLGFALLSDGGFGPSVVRAVAYFYAGRTALPTQMAQRHGPVDAVEGTTPYWQGIGQLMATLGRVYWLILALTAVLLALPGCLMVRNLVSLSAHPAISWLAYLATCVSALATVATIRWSSLAQGFGQLVQVRAIEIGVGLLRLGAYFVLLIGGQGLLALMLCTAVCALLTLTLQRRSTLAWLEGQAAEVIERGRYAYDPAIFTALWPATWRMGAILVGSYGISNAVSLLVSQSTDPALIASFLFSSRLIQIVRQLAQVPLYARLPQVIQLVARRETLAVKQFFSRAVALEMYLMLVALMVLALGGNALLAGVGLRPLLLAPELFVPLGLWAVLEAHHSAHAQLYMTSNHIPFLVPALLSGAAIVGLGYLVQPLYGVAGLVFVQLGVQAAWNNWYPVRLSLQWLDWRFADYVKDTFMWRKVGPHSA